MKTNQSVVTSPHTCPSSSSSSSSSRVVHFVDGCGLWLSCCLVPSPKVLTHLLDFHSFWVFTLWGKNCTLLPFCNYLVQKSSFLVSAVESKSSFVVTTNNPPVTYLKLLCFTCVGGRKHFPCSNFFLFLLAFRIVGFLPVWSKSHFAGFSVFGGRSFLFVLCFVSCVFVEDFWWHFHLFVFSFSFLVSFWWHFVVFEKAARRGRENKEVGDGCWAA